MPFRGLSRGGVDFDRPPRRAWKGAGAPGVSPGALVGHAITYCTSSGPGELLRGELARPVKLFENRERELGLDRRETG